VSTPAVVVATLSLDELRAIIREELRAAVAECAPAPAAAPLVDRRGIACLLAVSLATVTRLTAEGMPCTHVGDAPRYSADEVRAWLTARGRRGTSATPSRTTGPIGGVRILSRGRS
jgi:hypothetical protein